MRPVHLPVRERDSFKKTIPVCISSLDMILYLFLKKHARKRKMLLFLIQEVEGAHTLEGNTAFYGRRYFHSFRV